MGLRMRVAAAAATVALVGCGYDLRAERESSDGSFTPRTAEMFRGLHGGAAGVDTLRIAEDLSDYLPGQFVSRDGAEPVPMASGIVRGDIVSARVSDAGRTYETASGEEAEEVSPDSPDAHWRHIEATVHVTETWGEQVEGEKHVRFVIPIGGSADAAPYIDGLVELDDVIAVLSKSPREDVHRIVETSLALGVVGPHERLTFPGMSGPEATAFTKVIGNLKELRRRAYVKEPLIRVDRGIVDH